MVLAMLCRRKWHIYVGYTANGIAEITILDAKAAGYWHLENAKE
jgi:hypothetical protein